MNGGSIMAKRELDDLKELNALDTNAFLDADEFDDYEAYFDNDDDSYSLSKPESDGGALTSLILGIIGSLGWMIPIIGLPVTIVGTVFGAINMTNRRSKGIAIAGFVVNVVFLTASIAKGIIDIIKWMRKAK